MVTNTIALENGVGHHGRIDSSIFDQIGKIFNGVMTQVAARSLSEAGSALVDALKINSIKPMVQNQRQVFVKERQIQGEQIAELANLYFDFCGIPIRFWTRTWEWRQWEISCFTMLNGDSFRAAGSGPRAIVQDKLPGKSLWKHMQEGTLTPRMLKAAAREFHRAHQFWSAELDGLWSHGDATAANVIYDEISDRARLIDFETCHKKSIPAVIRHADDLLTLLLDIVGHVSSQQWLSLALPFIKAYQDREVIAQLRQQLVPPRGIAWIWWEVRTGFTNPAKVKRRLESLRRSITEQDSYGPIPYMDQRYPIKDRIPKPGFLTTTLVRA